MIKLLITLVTLLPAKPAAYVVALAHGRIDIAPQLVRICKRETYNCAAVGIHEVDAHLSARSYWGQVQLGHLDRRCQRHGDVHGRWSTRGAFGLNAAVHWPYLPRCYQPEWLDVPLVSAYVATRKYLRVCDGRKMEHRDRWCPLGKKERDRRKAERTAHDK